MVRAPDGTPQLYIVGGAQKEGVASVERYSVSDGWEFIQPLAIARGYGVATGVALNRLYAIGGSADGKTPVNDVEVYSVTNRVWNRRHSVERDGEPYPVQHALVTGMAGKLYLFGGIGPQGPLKGTMIYDPDGRKWFAGADMPRARSGGRAAALDGRIVLVGGVVGEDGRNAIDVYDPATDTWQAEHSIYPGGNFRSPAIAQGENTIFVLGDASGSPHAQECWMGRLTEW